MKKLTILFLLIPFLTNAQDWAPIGAIWHYDQIDFIPPEYNDLITYESVGDTVINGDAARIIHKTTAWMNPGTGDVTTSLETIYEKMVDNRVYFYYEPVNDFRLLYDFNAQVGDTYSVFCRESQMDSSVTVTVDALSTIVVGGETLIVQEISAIESDNICNIWGTIIERIGWLGYRFPQHQVADPPEGGPLRCYEDLTIGLYDANPNIACDFITAVSEPDALQQVQIFPNPSSGKIQIVSDIVLEDIILRDALGRIIRSFKNTKEIDFSDLKNGVYLLSFTIGNKGGTRRIVKTVE